MNCQWSGDVLGIELEAISSNYVRCRLTVSRQSRRFGHWLFPWVECELASLLYAILVYFFFSAFTYHRGYIASTRPFHLPRSRAFFFQSLSTVFSIRSFHRSLGLPLFLFPSTSNISARFGGCFSSIRDTCPAQFILSRPMKARMWVWLVLRLSSSFFRLRYRCSKLS